MGGKAKPADLVENDPKWTSAFCQAGVNWLSDSAVRKTS
jgi:hypothetical protein